MKVFGLLVLLLVVVSCGKIETSGNGKLDGYWHLETIDTLATGGVNDLSDKLLFWSVQSNLLDVIDRQNGAEALSTFEHKGDSLLLSNPCTPVWDGDDTPIDDVNKLRQFGINSLSPKFLIESMSGSKMILRDDSVRLRFRKQ